MDKQAYHDVVTGSMWRNRKKQTFEFDEALHELTVDWIYQLMLATGLKMHGPVGNWRASALKLLLACVLLGYVGVAFRCAKGSEVL